MFLFFYNTANVENTVALVHYELLTFFQRHYARVAEETISMMERFVDFLRKFKSRPQQITDISSKHQEKNSYEMFRYEHYCRDFQLTFIGTIIVKLGLILTKLKPSK